MNTWLLTQHSHNTYENTRIVEECTKKALSIQLYNPNNFDIIVNNIKNGVRYNGKYIELPKSILVRTGSSTNYFTSTLLKHFENLNLNVFNSSESINIARDKLNTHQILSHNNISTPKTMLVKFPVCTNIVQDELGFPCVVKVLQGSYGNGVYLCNTRHEFNSLMGLLKTLAIKKTLMIQEYINTAPGVDLRVWVIGGEVLGAMKRTAPKGDFRANITNGGTGEKYTLTDEIKTIALKAASALKLDIAGVDLLFDHNSFKVCEVNSAPGFEGFEKYCGVNIAEQIINFALQKTQNER